MSKSRKIAAIVAMVAILGMATVAVVAYAQDATTGSGPVWDLGQKVKEAVAAALGISVDKYDETVTTAQKQVLDEAVAAGQLTQTQADEMLRRLEESPGMGFMGPGMGRGRDDQRLLLTVAADELGMTEADLTTALEDGKSIADVAKDKGVDTEAITSAYLAQLKIKLDAQVADGSLTQAQADARLEQETQELPNRLTQAWKGRGMDHRRGDQELLLTVADELGMTEADLRTALQGGKSITDVAKDKGVDTQAITDAFLAQLKTKLDAQVADGSLTQAQADERLEQETQGLSNRLSQAWNDFGKGPGRGRPGGGGPGGPAPDEIPDSTGQDGQ